VITAVILAAGESKRMKTQKLLLPYGEGTVVESVVRAALDSSVDGVLVVLGADGDEIREKLGAVEVDFVVNENYREGMLSSIQAGFGALPEKVRAAVLMLGDQPAVTAEANDELIARYRETRKGIVIPTHGGRRGHPVVIDTKYKKEIAGLDPEAGLRRLRLDHPDDVLEVELPFPEILKDIDTPEDYAADN
jgi:molybdenum cofactor cytidylyltransferase